MSAPNLNSGLESPLPAAARPRRKPQADLYTILLAISLVAILLGILFLYLFMQTYEFKFPDKTPVGMVTAWFPTVCSFAGP